MKCEIINGWLVVEPGTPTERYAFAQWLESRPSWNSVQSSVRAHDPKIDAPEPNPVMVWAAKHTRIPTDDGLDVFGNPPHPPIPPVEG